MISNSFIKPPVKKLSVAPSSNQDLDDDKDLVALPNLGMKREKSSIDGN
jgi:hypothetical protein